MPSRAPWIELVRAARIEAGLSQADLAQRAGVAVSYVALLERGDRGHSPPRATVVRFAEALGVDAEPMLERTGYLEAGQRLPDRSETIDAIRRDSLLTPDERDALEVIYRRLAGLKRRRR